jgi:hypothetical protein
MDAPDSPRDDASSPLPLLPGKLASGDGPAGPDGTRTSAARFLVLTLCLVGVRIIFRHLDATFPKYMLRAHGQDTKFGLVYSLNPLTIITLVPLLSSKSPSRVLQLYGGRSRTLWLSSARGPVTAAGGAGARLRLDGFRAWLHEIHAVDAILLGTSISTASVLFLWLSQTIVRRGRGRQGREKKAEERESVCLCE